MGEVIEEHGVVERRGEVGHGGGDGGSNNKG